MKEYRNLFAFAGVLFVFILFSIFWWNTGQSRGQTTEAPVSNLTVPPPAMDSHTRTPQLFETQPSAVHRAIQTGSPSPTFTPRPAPTVADTVSQLTTGPLPYPASRVIRQVIWDYTSLNRAAVGSDLFPLTWADDDNLYASWGDGWGFSESGRKRYMGVSRIDGGAEDYTGTDLWSGVGKSHGIISIDGVLYLAYSEQGSWRRGKVGYSRDHGKTWTFNQGWTFNEAGGAFTSPNFLQFGKDYDNARDHYVYGYSERVQGVIQPDIVMFRVPKDELMERRAYEFFAGIEANGTPKWSRDSNDMKPVFSDPNGVTWGIQVIYHPVLDRYLLTVRQADQGSGWAIFDAPEPWGPWTTVAYYDRWLDETTKIMYTFNQKWMSADGRTMWMVFNGVDEYDSFNGIKAFLELWE